MDLAFRLILYIFIANVGFMIFSLARKGVRVYLGYLVQLSFILLMMIALVGWGTSGWSAIFLSLGSLGLVILVPLTLQKRIERLITEQKFGEIEPLARWKAHLAWSQMNLHMLSLAKAVKVYEVSSGQGDEAMKALLGLGEPYDGMTRLFMAMVHFHLRQFESLIDDLVVPGKPEDEYGCDELFYIIRGYLEVGRYEDAFSSQLALEKKIRTEDLDAQRGNLLVNRLLFFAFLGWKEDFEHLFSAKDAVVESLPGVLKDFWRGVALTNSGSYEDGRVHMEKALASMDDQFPEMWAIWMKKRIEEMAASRQIFQEQIFPRLERLKKERRPELIELIAESEELIHPPPTARVATDNLSGVIVLVFFLTMLTGNSDDYIDLLKYGANSGLLVWQGDYFRLISSLFLHIGFIHLFMNIIALRYFGPPVETVVGWQMFLGIYFFSGLVASLASAWWHPGLSVGASGAVLGLLSIAIVLEWLGEPKMRACAPKGNLVTMLFILAINMVIGLVEKGVDNVAHLGGLAGGAVAGVVVYGLLQSPVLRTLGRAFSLLFIALLLTGSAWQFGSTYNNLRYPFLEMVKSPAVRTFPLEFELPKGWIRDTDEADPEKNFSRLYVGPLSERLEIIVGENDESVSAALKSYADDRTRGIVDASGVKLRAVRDPEKVIMNGKEFYRMQWRFSSGNRPLVERDYFLFEGNQFVLLQCLFPTDHDDRYQPMLEKILSSMKLIEFKNK